VNWRGGFAPQSPFKLAFNLTGRVIKVSNYQPVGWENKLTLPPANLLDIHAEPTQ